MKLISKIIDKKNCGTVSMIAEEAEDMWHCFNLISVGDYLKSNTIRRVVNESATGLTTTSRVHTTLTILVKSLDFDTQAGVLRVKGTNFEENPFVKMGAYHTIDLELKKKFDITKQEWDSVALERIDEACDPSKNADVAAIVMQEGLANLCLILSTMTLVKAKIEMPIPRKRKGLCANHDKGLEKFFERIVQALITHINFDIVKAVIIASPGFIKDQFLEYMNSFSARNISTHKILVDNRHKFMTVHSASGFKHSLKEIFEDQNLAPRLSDTKALSEVKALDAFFMMFKSEPNRAFYGFKHVQKANESDAIDILLISDSLFRSKELSERKKYVNIVDKVKENGGQVKIFSSLHVSGEQLLQYSGIAAILRFPMPDIEEDSSSDSDDDDKKKNGHDKETIKPNGHICTVDDEPTKSKLNPTDSASPFGSNSNIAGATGVASANTASNLTIPSTNLKQSPSSSTLTKQATSLMQSTLHSASSPAMPINKNAGGGKKTKRFTNKENYNDDDDDYQAPKTNNNNNNRASSNKKSTKFYNDDDDYDGYDDYDDFL